MPTLTTTLDQRVLRLTLTRSDKRNALDLALCRALVSTIEAAASDPHIGAILLTADPPAFCAGMDLHEIEVGGDSEEMDAIHEQLFTLGARIPKPILAAVRGSAVGGGTGLVANCHIVVAAPHARFGLTEIRLGLWPFLIFRAVTAALGERRTLELSLTGRNFPAPEALAMGLVHEIADDPETRALAIARTVSEFSPTAIETGLAFVNRVRGLPSAEAGQIARSVRKLQFQEDDFREGIHAFREKRHPRWPSLPK